MENAMKAFKAAEELFVYGSIEEAAQIYASLAGGEVRELAAISYMRLGEIANRAGKPVYARRLLFRAFKTYPALARLITAENHPSHQYVYPGRLKEKCVRACPLCGNEGKPYWSFNMATNLDYQPSFNPVRTWMYCAACHHLYASAYPDIPAEPDGNEAYVPKASPVLFTPYSDLLNQLKGFAKGRRLLEVGIGGGELIAVAQEMGFDTFGLDISLNAVHNARQLFAVNVECIDFMKFQPDAKYDIICMGDVIEHIADPKTAIRRAGGMLEPGGLLWISTPNFDGAYSKYFGYNDPMKRVAGHLNYFSFRSLEKTLQGEQFKLLSYSVSKHYNGSMEVVARKL